MSNFLKVNLKERIYYLKCRSSFIKRGRPRRGLLHALGQHVHSLILLALRHYEAQGLNCKKNPRGRA